MIDFGWFIKPDRQCFQCQKFGHIARFCKEPAKCMLCGSSHRRDQCAPETAKKVICVNCGALDHRANYGGCPVAKDSLKKKLQPKRESQKAWTPKSGPTNPASETRTEWLTVVNGKAKSDKMHCPTTTPQLHTDEENLPRQIVTSRAHREIIKSPVKKEASPKVEPTQVPEQPICWVDIGIQTDEELFPKLGVEMGTQTEPLCQKPCFVEYGIQTAPTVNLLDEKSEGVNPPKEPKTSRRKFVDPDQSVLDLPEGPAPPAIPKKPTKRKAPLASRVALPREVSHPCKE